MKNIKYYIIVISILLSGAILLNMLLSNYNAFEKEKINTQLLNSHSDAILSAKAGIEVYATLVSSLKSFTKNSKQFPSEEKLQKYLKDLLKEIKFNDSIIVNYIDSDHVFKYVVTPTEIDPKKLKGISVKSFRPKERIDELDSLMKTTDIRIFTPVNLREGWTGFPFNFSARNEKDEVIGYIAPILNVKYLLNYFYKKEEKETYVHKFLVNDSLDLTREVFYNGSEIYNNQRDNEYYKKFNVNETDFIYSNIELFGLKLKVGSAYKNKPLVNKDISKIGYLWYISLSFLILLALHQYLKNRALNSNLEIANKQVVLKNKELESSLFKIQTLIKEIHHRIKNNMLMISGILSMQKDEYDEVSVKNALTESQNRIQSMSLVHEKLYGTESLKDVKIKEYVTQLIEFVEDTVKKKSLQLNKDISIDDLLIFDGDTTANIGLIINELLTNSFKYTFTEARKNNMSLHIIKEKDNFKLEYRDYGKGLPENFNIEASQSLGMQLISILTEQLNGELEYTNKPESLFTIYFNPVENIFMD